MGSATQEKQDLIIRLLNGDPDDANLAKDVENEITNSPIKATTVDTVTLGGLVLSIEQADDIRRMVADLDGKSTDDFTSLNTLTGVYSVPDNTQYLVGKTSVASNTKESISFGYADDAIGTNYVELIDEGVMTPENNYSSSSDFIFSIPENKFPIVNNKKNITTGFLILEGIEKPSVSASASALGLPSSVSFKIDASSATNALLQLILNELIDFRNTTTSTTITDGITLNTTTTIKLLDANPDRLYVCINNNDSTKGAWIKLQAASEDNDQKGIFLTSKNGERVFWQMTPGNIYTGEISAIADVDEPILFVTEY